MSIFGIIGGIGTGETLTGISLALSDLHHDKKLYTNTILKKISRNHMKNVTYLTKETLVNIFEKVKNKEFDMRNSTVFIQEMHNYVDSRRSMTQKNRVFTYWILQSRHTGEGSCNIIYDTQEINQVDIRLRRNTDYIFRPTITVWERKGLKKKPKEILIMGEGLIGHRRTRFQFTIDVTKYRDMYDTHEIVEF